MPANVGVAHDVPAKGLHFQLHLQREGQASACVSPATPGVGMRLDTTGNPSDMAATSG